MHLKPTPTDVFLNADSELVLVLPHDIELKCSPDEILARNCLYHVICPYKEISQISRYIRVRVSANAFVKDWVRVRVGIRLEG